MTELRPYQREAIDAILAYWGQGGGNPLVDMATGTGKSVVIATLVRELLQSYPDLRVLMLVHQRELVSQNAAALLRSWPQAPIGINSAGLGRRDWNSKILFSSVQSVFRHAAKLGQRDLIIIDECHLVPRDGNGMYRTLFANIIAPDGYRVAGFSATPFRMDSGRLDKGDDKLFDKIVYSYGIARGIEDGYLTPLVSKATATALDVSGVAKRGGEFVAGALEIAVDKDWITRAAVDEIVRFGEPRKSWLVFCSGVSHAQHVAAEIAGRGISAAAVTGETPGSERDRLIRAFKAGQIRCLTNAQVLTTGFDAPAVDLIAMLRPTLSAGLFVQICGRGTRLADGKTNCLVLDFAGNTKRFGPVDIIEIGSGDGRAEEKGEPLAKECPNCASLVALAKRQCPDCGYEWPERIVPKHDAVADAESSILSKGAPSWVAVDTMRCYRHEKPGSPPTMRVEYHCGFVVHREWVCLGHQGFARQKAERWWLRMGGAPIPRDADEALRRATELRTPSAIQVRPSGKYFEIVGRRFEQQEEAAA